MIISVFTPHGGCPERCTFCDQSVSGGSPVSAAMVTRAIEDHLSTEDLIADEIAFYGGTFTAMPRPRQLAYLEAAKPYLDSGRIKGVRISTRPDAIEAEWIEELISRFKLTTIELGVQSFHERSLAALGRSHSIDSVVAAVALLKKLRLKTSLHLMLGCPEERANEDEHTLQWIARLRPDFVRLHPLLVLRGTVLEQQWTAGMYTPLDLDDAIERAAGLVNAIEPLGVRVIRLGLQPNELLGEAIAAGAYHPAFGDLVRGRQWRHKISARLKERSLQSRHVELLVLKQLEGTIRGRKSENLKWLVERFELAGITVCATESAQLAAQGFEIRA